MSALKLSLHCQGDDGFALQLDCQLPAHGITAVYGPSGSGKSTLLDCIAGLRSPQPDSVIGLDDEIWQAPGVTVPSWKRRIGYVFQDARLFPHLNVQQNLDYAMARRAPPGTIDLDQVVPQLELDDLLSRAVDTLSAGQKQRVAIGRALLSSPQLLLLDEPLANLDHAARQQCVRCLQRLSDELQLPMLYVSHDIEEVSQLADHLLLLDRGQLVEQGSLLELCSRLDTRLSHEEQAAAILTASVMQHDSAFDLTQLAVDGQPLWVNHLPYSPGQIRRVRIPARDVSVCRARPQDSSILNILPVTLSEIEDTDSARVLLRLSLGSQFLLARITRKSVVELKLQIGDPIYAQIKSAALLMEASDQA
ncbi:Maltose/maltodextrin import ATP-binding protein MalK [Halioglobus japonicus]|nr:Maltose/maltodextrin import ATP-binding protein MalK [Halioglobus japonicus]